MRVERVTLGIPIEGMLPAPKACALGVMKIKMMQITSSAEVEPHLRPVEAIAGLGDFLKTAVVTVKLLD